MLESCEDSEIARELLELLGVSSGHGLHRRGTYVVQESR